MSRTVWLYTGMPHHQDPDAPTPLPARAKPGGETGKNGEFYPGGAFMPGEATPKTPYTKRQRDSLEHLTEDLRPGLRVRFLAPPPVQTMSGRVPTHGFIAAVLQPRRGRTDVWTVTFTLQGSAQNVAGAMRVDQIALDPFVPGQRLRRINEQPIEGQPDRPLHALTEDGRTAIFEIPVRNGCVYHRAPVGSLMPA